ncbi:MAG: hypothetical protein ACRD3T_12615, partial [Terriglobia bacterium]
CQGILSRLFVTILHLPEPVIENKSLASQNRRKPAGDRGSWANGKGRSYTHPRERPGQAIEDE